MTKRVLITGINGFAGRYLARHLMDQGMDVCGTTHGNAGQVEVGARTFSADLTDAERIGQVIAEVQPDYVAHLAAISFVAHENIGEIYRTNIMGSRNLLAALARQAVRPNSVLLVSSAAVYGNSIKPILEETDPINPANDYSVSKAAMEFMARQFSEKLNITIVRPFNYTGVGQSADFLVPKIVRHFREKLPVIELGNTDVSRDFSDVRTVVDYMARLMETPAAAGGVFNICSGQARSLQYILETCEALSGHSLKVEVSPKLQRANEIKSLAGDPRHLHQVVGEAKVRELSETLVWMLEA